MGPRERLIAAGWIITDFRSQRIEINLFGRVQQLMPLTSIGFRDTGAQYNDNIIVIIIIIIIIDLDRRRRPRMASERDKPRWAAPWPLQRPAMSYLFKRQRTGVRLNATRDRLPWPFVVQLSLITITAVRY